MSSALPAAPASKASRANAADIIASSGLPADVRRVVLDTVAQCRLWRSERAEVARELCAHFQDGLEAGVSPDDLIRDFGNPADVAPLFSRARKRLRPLWWRTLRRSAQGVGGIAVAGTCLYAILAARFFFASPRITHNYMTELNAPVLATPADQRAWPLYMQSIREFGPAPAFEAEPEFRADAPGDRSWNDSVAWAHEHKAAFDTLRRAAGKPVLGFVLTSDLDAEYRRTLDLTGRSAGPIDTAAANSNPLLVGVLLPHLGEVRRLARWLKADTRVAMHEGDSARAVANLDALLGMGDQVVKEPFIISQLVACAVYHLAIQESQYALTVPNSLSDDQLQHLAHRVAGFADGRVHVDFTAERAMYEDVLQRYYSDDGSGGGHFVYSAQDTQIYRDFGTPRPRGYPLLKAIQPVQSAILPSRRQLRTLLDQFEAQAVADDALPPWRHLERRSGALDQELNAVMFSLLPILRSLAGPESPVQNAFVARDALETQRGVTLTLIAFELHHRRTGRWPSSLEALSPQLLPALPLDPFDGKPLRYLPPEGTRTTPLLYSVGPDRQDDLGRMPVTGGGRRNVRRLDSLRLFAPGRQLLPEEAAAAEAARGDYILWPELEGADGKGVPG